MLPGHINKGVTTMKILNEWKKRDSIARLSALKAENAMLRGINADLLAALHDISRSDDFNGGTFILELQHIARAAIAKARGA
jgi:hypothetical protein